MSGAIHLLPLYAFTSRTGTNLSLHFSIMYKELILSAALYRNGVILAYLSVAYLTTLRKSWILSDERISGEE